ncbi:TRAP transporter small permease [Alkalihalobacillus sp. 1P02AB]|uniref:TRAP transporter small permease n=1 Tax=Alkalihalobacillus sp. 1P02AB TaxID=3132260 RepID=UPI0039A7332C
MKVATILDKWLSYITIIIFTSLLLVVVLQIICRYLPYNPIWTEELSRYLFVYSITVAAPLAIRKNEFIRVDMLIMLLPEKGRRNYEIFISSIIFLFGIVLFIEGLNFYKLGLDFISPTLGMQMSYVYVAVPILAVLIMVYSIIYIIDRFKNVKLEGEEL